jgi:hypothetical protein
MFSGAQIPGDLTVAPNILCVFKMELALYHPSGAENFEVAPKCLENFELLAYVAVFKCTKPVTSVVNYPLN